MNDVPANRRDLRPGGSSSCSWRLRSGWCLVLPLRDAGGDWNSARLLPAALLGADSRFICAGHGPGDRLDLRAVMPLLMCPASWLPT